MDTSQYLDIFVDETKEHIQVLSDQIMVLEKEPDNSDAIAEIFRSAHSLKGMAGTMGFKRMQRLTHDMENVFSAVREGKMKVNDSLVDTLFRGLDAIQEYLDLIQETSDEGDNDNEAIINELNQFLNGGGGEAPAAPAAKVEAVREPSPLRGTTEKMSRLRQTIARRMVESLQTAAQLTTVIEVDVTKVAAVRARSKDAFLAKHGTKLTFLPFFVKAATEALAYHPKINATINDKEVTYFDYEHVGIAVDTPRGLLVPVIKNAGEKDIPGIAASINDLAARTRDSKIGPDELSGSTFTVTNTGSGGALFDTPVLNTPETAIMGVGTIVKRPVVMKGIDGADVIAIRSMVYLSLSYDHRLVDGADASRFLMDVKKRLEAGEFEADLAL